MRHFVLHQGYVKPYDPETRETGEPMALSLRGAHMTCTKHDRFDVKQAMLYLARHEDGGAKPGDVLHVADDDGKFIEEHVLDSETYWRAPDEDRPVAVLQLTFEATWEYDEDPDYSWIEEWISSSVEEDADRVRCESCDGEYTVGSIVKTGEGYHKYADEHADEIQIEEGGPCPSCFGNLETLVALRIGHKDEPQPKDNPEDYVREREYFESREAAEKSAWERWGNRIEHEGCTVTATWNGLTGTASVWGVSFGPTSTYDEDQKYRRGVERELMEEALHELMERLQARAGLKLP
jgi:hypothetical protein